MDSSLHINPYFQLEPKGFFIGLKVSFSHNRFEQYLQVILAITLLTASVLLFLLVFKSPPQKSKVFRGLLAYHFIV